MKTLLVMSFLMALLKAMSIIHWSWWIVMAPALIAGLVWVVALMFAVWCLSLFPGVK